MAKIKAETPPKRAASKAKATPPPPTQLRRSPRKAVASARKLAAEAVSAPSKVVKRRNSPAKKTSHPIKAPSTAKKAAASAKPKGKASTPTPAKPRKRAKKTTPAKAAVAKRTPAKGTKSSPRKGPNASAPRTVVDAPVEQDEWTDSPAKKSPAKGKPKGPDRALSPAKGIQEVNGSGIDENTRLRQVSVGGVRKSIEIPNGTRPSRSLSPGGPIGLRKGISRKPRQGRIGPDGRIYEISTSMQSPSRSVRDRSKSPAKGAGSIANHDEGDLGTRASPSRPGNTGSQLAPRGQSRSPSRSSSRRPSIARASELETPRSPVETPRSPLKTLRSPVKTLKSPMETPKSPLETPKTSLETPRSPLSPPKGSLLGLGGTLKVSRQRSLSSPAKPLPPSHSRSPAKSPPLFSAGRRSSVQRSAPTRARSISPAKSAQRLVHPATAEQSFLARFNANDGYGKVLRGIESEGYRLAVHGENIAPVYDPRINDDDENMALRRGAERAELELGLSDRADSREQRGERHHGRKTVRRRNGMEEDDDRGVSSGVIGRSHPKVYRSPKRTPSNTTRRLAPQASPPGKSASGDMFFGEPSAPGHGPVRSVTNPEHIPGMTKKNAFFATLPGPEVWHRRMPPYFPFGDTPFMERVVSREISEDLMKGREEADAKALKSASLLSRATSSVKATFNAVGQSVFGATTSSTKRTQYPPMWELPDVSSSEVDKVVKRLSRDEGSVDNNSTKQKRKGSSSSVDRAVKRVRHRSSGEVRMSGALQNA